jgi:hypothetical protein
MYTLLLIFLASLKGNCMSDNTTHLTNMKKSLTRNLVKEQTNFTVQYIRAFLLHNL